MMICNLCQREMQGTTAYDGACECGGLISASQPPYREYRYLWPPRPENAAPPDLIPYFEKRGWWGQVKKNGTCTVIFANGGEVTFKTRHNDNHALWTPLAEHEAFFRRPGWNVYVAELLHSKTPHIKNHLYLFDALVWDGEELVGATYEERQDLLRDRFPGPGGAGLGTIRLSGYVSRAANYTEDFQSVWNDLGEEDEGIVFKNPAALLLPCSTATANGAWQAKIRRPHKNYSF